MASGVILAAKATRQVVIDIRFLRYPYQFLARPSYNRNLLRFREDEDRSKSGKIRMYERLKNSKLASTFNLFVKEKRKKKTLDLSSERR